MAHCSDHQETRSCRNRGRVDDIASSALTFAAGAAGAADIIACTTGAYGFAAGTASTADGADTAVTADGAPATISACCTVATANGCTLLFLLALPDSLELLQ